MTLGTHVYALRNLLSKGPSTDDSSFSLRLIAHYLNVARALLTEQKADKYTYISEQSFQSLCIPLTSGTFHGCCSVTDIDCKIFKSVSPIPKFLNTRWGDFVKVMTLLGETISKGSMTMNKYAAYTVTNSTPKTAWFINDNHLYIINNKNLELVMLNSLFSDPIEVTSLNCAPGTTGTGVCGDWLDAEYPIDPDLVSPAYNMVLQFFRTSMSLPPNDTSNDATDNQTA
jgi:hypothetical protein